jgi:ADP-heptose:LPS heptosyltransferase
VLTTPALDILKRARPDLRVAVMVEDRFRDIFEGNPSVDRILPPRLAALRRLKPHLCLNLHGGSRSAWMTALSGARTRAGFGHFRGQFVYNLRIPRAQQILAVSRKVHTAEHLASAMFYLGAPIGEIPRATLAALPAGGPPGLPSSSLPPRPYVVIHPVGATPEKTWRAEGFLQIAEHLRTSGLDSVFIGGASDDLSAFRAWRVVSGAPLSRIKSLLAASTLFVGNDSGPAHMAAAFGVPSVVIFGPSDPAIWCPWRTPSEVVRAQGGIRAVEIAQVLGALARLKVAA